MAIKVLHPDSEFSEQWRASSRPSPVRRIDHHTSRRRRLPKLDEGSRFLVLEPSEGITLRDLDRERPRSARGAAIIGQQPPRSAPRTTRASFAQREAARSCPARAKAERRQADRLRAAKVPVEAVVDGRA